MIKTPLACDYTVADVYDDAAVIGKELEKIIANYGTDIIKDLMPKVIHVLELLESLIIKNEKESDEINELKTRVAILEAEKMNRLNAKEDFEKELEEIENKWKEETLKLIDMVNKLKDDNKQLQLLIANTTSNMQNEQRIVIKQEELDYIKNVKEENIKLKESIRHKDREISQRNTELEALQSQADSLTNTILNFRRKQILNQNQTQKLVKEKAELECCLKEREHQMNLIRSQMRKLSETDEYPVSSKEMVRIDSIVETNMNGMNERDPNRPRYTLKELHDVLTEKNELKVKLHETLEELDALKKQSEENLIDGEVQGPINKEPEEKLDPKNKQSGIRRFFRRFFLNEDSDTESPQTFA